MSCRDLIRDIIRGEEGPGPARRLASGEDGMIALVAIVTVLFFFILALLVGNVALIVNQKIEVQNAADALAKRQP